MTDNSETPHPKIFVSYSHDDQRHRNRILELAERLRTDGFETMIDQYVEGTPLQGWPRWMLNQMEWADYVLLVCTKTYYRRFRGHEAPDVGKGVDWEGAIITNELYDRKSVSRRFVPVLFDSGDSDYIPEPIRAFSFHVLTSEEAYRKLTNYLAGAAGIQPAELGPAPTRKRDTGVPLSFKENDRAETTHAFRGGVPDLSAIRAPGGTMPADDNFYIERGADQRAKAAAARSSETIVVRGPHQFGKSSLLAHYVALCRANGKVVASVDFSRFERSTICDYGRFLTALASQLARRLRLAGPESAFKTQQEFLEFLESTLLPAVNGPIVFAFDETDRIMPQHYAQDFFSMVRMWHNDRADPVLEWHRVGLALASSSEPKLFIKDALRSPFSVGLRLPLESFTTREVIELNARYGSPLSEADCDSLYRLVGGHPFLMQDAYYKLFGPDSIPFTRLCTQAAQDDGPFGEHLRAMLSNVIAAEGLLAAVKQAVDRGTVPRSDDFYRLEGAGLVRRAHGGIELTNQIYADFFRSVS
jgi:hypothetical protein